MFERPPPLDYTLAENSRRMSLFRDDTRGPELASLYREIGRLAWPAFVGQGLNAVVIMISRVIVGQLGEKAYNSVNVGMMVFFVIVTVIAAVGVGTTALVAQAWGAGDKKRAGEVLQQSILLGFLITLAIALLGMPASRLLYHLLGADEQTIAEGSRFLVWLFAAIPLMAPGFFLAAGLRGAGDTLTPMIVGMIMGLFSLVLSYGLILGHFGLPRLGTLGAALAIDAAFFSFSLILGMLFLFNDVLLKLPARGWRLDMKTGMSILKIGIPSALEWVLIQLGILIYIFVIYRYGDSAAAGYFTGVAILGFAQTPAFGLQTAATTLVGQSVGAKNFKRAESAFRHCVLLGLGLMLVVGTAIYFAATPSLLSWMFSKLTPESIEYSRRYTVLIVFVMPLMGISFTIAGGLRGAGDTIPPLAASAIGVYLGRIAIAFTVYALFHPPVLVIWCSMFPDLILRILVMALRLRSGKWKEVAV